MNAKTTIRMIPTRIGTRTDKKDTTVENTSSAMLTGTFPAPPVVAVTAGLTARALTECTPPATSSPAASESTGLMSVMTSALAAKAIAPAAGRTKVWIRSLMWLTAGSLSVSISMMTRMPSRIRIHGLARVSQGVLRLIRSV